MQLLSSSSEERQPGAVFQGGSSSFRATRIYSGIARLGIQKIHINLDTGFRRYDYRTARRLI